MEDARRARGDSIAATTPPESAAPAATVAGGLVSRTCFFHGQAAPVDFLSVQGIHGRGRLGVIGELHEPESLGPARVAVGDDLRRFRLAVRCEEISQLSVVGVVREVAYVEFHWTRPWCRSPRHTLRPCKNT